MKHIKGGITAPRGFKAAGISCGIKSSGKKDLALIVSNVIAEAAAVFTSNKVKAAPVKISKERIESGKVRTIIVNSGNANCLRGAAGEKDTLAMIKKTAKSLNISPKHVLVASTGSIAKPMPMRKILPGIVKLSKKISTKGGHSAAQAILTTDTRTKEIALKIKLFGKDVVIGGMAKGAGMIAPNLATMLAFITTDANIKSGLLKKSLKQAVSKSFNMITVDKEQSTNDSVFVLANGLSGTKEIKDGTSEYKKFYEALEHVAIYLAKEIARDGEGSTRLIEVRVAAAKTESDAEKVAKAVVGSALFKAAVFGEDPNFGRIVSAAGGSGADINPDFINVYIGDNILVKKGVAVEFNEAQVKKYLKRKEIAVTVDLGQGSKNAVAWGCDLTYDYVRINARYHT